MGVIRTTDGENLPETIRGKRRRRWRIGLSFAALGITAGLTGLLIKVDRSFTAAGYVTTVNYAEVRPAATGRVAAILASSGALVEAGQVLVRLDDSEQQASLAEAQSRARMVEAELARRGAEIAEEKRQHSARINEAAYLLDDVAAALERIRGALADRGYSEDLSAELALLRASRNDVRQAQAELTRREAEIQQTIAIQKWELAEAELLLQNAHTRSSRTEQLVQEKLAPALALDEVRLQEQLTALKVQEYKSRDDSVFSKELALLNANLVARQDAVQQTEANLRRRLTELELKQKLAQMHLQGLRDKDLSVYDKELAVRHQELQAAREAVARADAQLQARLVRAPISGQAQRYEFVLGELIKPDTVLFEIFGGEQQVLKLKIAERYATRVAPGQPYEAELAPYKGLRKIVFSGELSTLRSTIQGDGQTNYRVAYCSFDPKGLTVPPGTTAEARVYYGYSCLWLFLFGLY